MTRPQANSFRCVLPSTHQRAHAPGTAGQMSAGNAAPTARTLPRTHQRGLPPSARAAALSAAGLSCQLPHARDRDGQYYAASQVEDPNGQAQAPAPVQAQAPVKTAEPQPVAPPVTAPVAGPDAPQIPVETLLAIVQRVARGISIAAGYAYAGAEPDGAGLRFGLLGYRLDTGDMGAVLANAMTRDTNTTNAALGPHAAEIMATVNAQTPEARRAAVAGQPLWVEPHKSVLSQAGNSTAIRASQNEYAVEGLLTPALEMLSANPSMVSGTCLAIALDVLAEQGRAAGLGLLEASIVTAAGSEQALLATLKTACPGCRERLDSLYSDVELRGLLVGAPA